MTQPTLRTTRLLLRPFGMGDASVVQRLAGAAAVADTTQNIPHPYEDGLAEAWIASHEPAYTRGERVVFAITEQDGNLVGAINLNLRQEHHRAELGYWIGEPYWGRGYATEAAQAIIEYGFTTLALNRIVATHLTRNPASGRVMQKAGMRHEGVQRQHVYKNGRFEDLESYGIIRGAALVPAFPGAVPEVPVSNISTAATYYQNQLGFSLDWGGDDGGIAGLSRGDCRLFLTNRGFRETNGNAAPIVIWLNLNNRQEVDDLHAAWSKSQARIVSPPESKPWKLHEFTAADPDGNLFRVFYDFSWETRGA
jgi:ribosomal-protein-alanine N-acetyltransferase